MRETYSPAARWRSGEAGAEAGAGAGAGAEARASAQAHARAQRTAGLGGGSGVGYWAGAGVGIGLRWELGWPVATAMLKMYQRAGARQMAEVRPARNMTWREEAVG